MHSIDESWYRDYLSCPDCRGELFIKIQSICCSKCSYISKLSGTAEIKPKSPTSVSAQLPRVMAAHPSDTLKTIEITSPEISYDGPSAIRDSRELMSEMKNYLGSKGLVLDLGCGPRDQAIPVHYMGYQYVGVDYSNQKADILADAHAIPFKDKTFDCVLSYAVLEHLHNPFICVSEIERVLRPGGVYIGTVSQGEPFHDSYFHHTAWGFISLVSSITTLQIKRIWSSGDTLASLSRMGRYPRVIRQLLKLIDKIHISIPWLAPRKMKWPERERRLDIIHKAGSVCFVVQKPFGNREPKQ